MQRCKKNGGERGIRTPETVSRLHAFQACAFNHSATSPMNINQLKSYHFNSKKFQYHSKYFVCFLNQKDKYLSARYAYNLCWS